MGNYPISSSNTVGHSVWALNEFERTVERVTEARLPTEFGEFRLIGYESVTSNEEFVVLAKGQLRPEHPTLVRIHSQCLTGDVFGSIKCDCGQQLRSAMKQIADEGCGVIVYQQQEGRGIGILNKIRAYELQDGGADTVEANERLGLPVDMRNYDQCAEILADIGLCRIRLLSNNPEKFNALRRAGMEIAERVPLRIKFHHQFEGYLRTKHEKMGHFLNLSEEQRNEQKRRCNIQTV